MQQAFDKILVEIGEDVTREGLIDTPERAAKALKEITIGYSEKLETVINGAVYESDMNEMVLVKDIELYSMCEHHLLPFIGKCHIAYIPNGKIIGLSKIARIADHFSKRLQVQENLTKEIAECLMETVDAKGVGVIIEAQHLCMMMRGVQKQNSTMTTSMLLGRFKSDARTRMEFLNLIK